MTVAEVERKLAFIVSVAGDDEMAHGLEDCLHCDVLQAIADGCENPAALAEAALKSADIPFARHCA